MTGQEQYEAVRRYVMTADPITAGTQGACYRQAWLASGLNMAYLRFRDILKRLESKPIPNGELWTLEFRGSGS